MEEIQVSCLLRRSIYQGAPLLFREHVVSAHRMSLMKKIVNTQSACYLNADCEVNIFSLFLSFQRDYQYYNEFGELKYGLSGVDLLLCLIVRLFPHCVSLMIAVWPCLKLAVSESGFNIVLDKAMTFSHGFTLRISVCVHIDNKLIIRYSVHFGSFSLFTIQPLNVKV